MRISDWSSDVCSSDLGFTPALAMSAFAIMVGAIMLRHYRRLLSLWDRLPLPEARALYEQGVGAAVGWGRTATLAIHNSSLQRQLALLFAVALLLGIEGLWKGGYASEIGRAHV